MDKSKARSIVNEIIVPLRDALGLHAWTLDVLYEKFDDEGCLAKVRPKPEYQRATIWLHHDGMTNKKELLSVLLHELLHLVHAEFVQYRAVCIEDQSNTKINMTDVSYSSACERTVVNLENMLKNLRLSPEKLVRRVERTRKKRQDLSNPSQDEIIRGIHPLQRDAMSLSCATCGELTIAGNNHTCPPRFAVGLPNGGTTVFYAHNEEAAAGKWGDDLLDTAPGEMTTVEVTNLNDSEAKTVLVDLTSELVYTGNRSPLPREPEPEAEGAEGAEGAD